MAAPKHEDDQDYLDSLSRSSLERLSNEPVRLSSERRKIDNALEQLSVNNYRVHVDNHRTVRDTATACVGMKEAVSLLQEEANKLGECQGQALERATHIAATYQRYRRTLRQHSKLLELFEIPQLMSRCVRVNAVSEALDLATFVIKMEQVQSLHYRYSIEKGQHQSRTDSLAKSPGGLTSTHSKIKQEKVDAALLPQKGSGIHLIFEIVQDVIQSLDVLFNNLTRRLSRKIQLTEALQVIGYLRRLKVVYANGVAATEKAKSIKGSGSRSPGSNGSRTGLMPSASSLSQPLHEIFLKCREHFFDKEVEQIPSSETPNHYLDRLADIYRIHLHELITQYRAIFGKVGENTNLSLSGNTATANSTRNDEDDKAQLLSHIVFSHISFIVDRVRTYTPMIDDGSSLSNIVEQYMNLGHSMAKVGADFRPLLVAPFETAMLGLALPSWNNGYLAFEAAIKDLDQGSMRLTSTNEAKSPWDQIGNMLISKESVSTESVLENAPKHDGHLESNPCDGENMLSNFQERLLLFRPLAHLTNAFIEGFNELRKCASLSIRERVRARLIELIRLVVKTISASKASLCEINGENLDAWLKQLLRVEFVGMLAFCFRSVYPEALDSDDTSFAREAGLSPPDISSKEATLKIQPAKLA